MREVLFKLRRHPVGTVVRGLQKTVLDRRRYGTGAGYDASRFWSDRFSRYGTSLKAAGDDGLSEEENRAMYAEAARVFTEVCLSEGVDFQNARVLEIGCGTGSYARVLQDLGVRSYVGVDITDVVFPELRKTYPDFEFVQRDITAEGVEGTFDLVFMIDVLEHIVEPDRLTKAMENVSDALAEEGVLVLAPLLEESRRHLYYVRFWSIEDIRARFPGYAIGEPRPFRMGNIVTIRKQPIATRELSR
jgi:SAM-dependent methyltransferase